jgi:hypothetical protein
VRERVVQPVSEHRQHPRPGDRADADVVRGRDPGARVGVALRREVHREVRGGVGIRPHERRLLYEPAARRPRAGLRELTHDHERHQRRVRPGAHGDVGDDAVGGNRAGAWVGVVDRPGHARLEPSAVGIPGPDEVVVAVDRVGPAGEGGLDLAPERVRVLGQWTAEGPALSERGRRHRQGGQEHEKHRCGPPCHPCHPVSGACS